MGAIYGRRWAASFGAQPDGEVARLWGLATADLSDEQLACAVEHFARAGSTWPPSSGEFRRVALALPPLAETRLALLLPADQPDGFTKMLRRRLARLGYAQLADAAARDRMLAEQHAHLVEQVQLRGTYSLDEPQSPTPTAPAQPQRIGKSERADVAARAALGDIAAKLGLTVHDGGAAR